MKGGATYGPFEVGEEVVVDLSGAGALRSRRGVPWPPGDTPTWTIGVVTARRETAGGWRYDLRFRRCGEYYEATLDESAIEGTA
jgi:hypothetical protein